jgi:hypothetical protein
MHPGMPGFNPNLPPHMQQPQLLPHGLPFDPRGGQPMPPPPGHLQPQHIRPPGPFGPPPPPPGQPGQYRPEYMGAPNGQPPGKMMRPSSRDGMMPYGPGPGQPQFMNGMPPGPDGQPMSQQQHHMMMMQAQDPGQGPLPPKEEKSKSNLLLCLVSFGLAVFDSQESSKAHKSLNFKLNLTP